MRKVSPEDFKDNQGRWRTSSLFMETNKDESKYPSIFTLGDTDRDGRISMQRLYLAANDPTEYLAAKHIFGSLDCWDNLTRSPFFQPYLASWRKDLHGSIRSRGIRKIEEAAEKGSVNGPQLAAAKWLATQEWDGNKLVQGKRSAGRPPKTSDPEMRLKEALDGIKEEEADLARISKS